MRILVVAAFGIVVALSPAAAQDKCLTGASTLLDQRALVNLRTATETACPCASFTGAPGATASAYRKCASTVLKSALTAGDVRTECKKTAPAINKGAVCGSTKIACGRFTPTGKTPLRCSVKKASSCKDGKKFEENACTAQTRCADVVDWTASTCADVRATGSPSLTMLGQIDSVVSDPAIRTAYAASSMPKYLVEVENAGHNAFSDGCFPSADCNPPTTLTQDEAHDVVRRWALPFLEVYLAGDTSFSSFLAPITAPGYVLDAQP